MLHTLGRPARPVVTGERWGRGSEPYGLCIRTAYTDACASLRDGSESNIHSEGSRRTGGQESLFLSWVSGLGRGPATLFTLEHSAGCAGKPDTRLSVHVPSSLTIPRHTAACLARAYSWGGVQGQAAPPWLPRGPACPRLLPLPKPQCQEDPGGPRSQAAPAGREGRAWRGAEPSGPGSPCVPPDHPLAWLEPGPLGEGVRWSGFCFLK